MGILPEVLIVSNLPLCDFGTIPFFHSSLGMTPFQALYGREPPALLRYNDSSQDPPTVREVLHNRQMLLNRLKGNLINIQTEPNIKTKISPDIVITNQSKVKKYNRSVRLR